MENVAEAYASLSTSNFYQRSIPAIEIEKTYKDILEIMEKLLWTSLVMMMSALCRMIFVEAEKRYPWDGEILYPQPRKGWDVILKQCAATLTEECAQQYYDYTFYRIGDLDINCCNKLVKLDRSCIKIMADTFSSIAKYQRWRGHIYNRSMEGYQDCLRRV